MHGDCQDFFGQLLLITLSDHWGSCFNLFIEFHKPVALGTTKTEIGDETEFRDVFDPR